MRVLLSRGVDHTQGSVQVRHSNNGTTSPTPNQNITDCQSRTFGYICYQKGGTVGGTARETLKQEAGGRKQEAGTQKEDRKKRKNGEEEGTAMKWKIWGCLFVFGFFFPSTMYTFFCIG